MSLFKKLGKRLRIQLPGGTIGKYGKVGKILGALAIGPVAGPVNPLSMDPEVLGARGSARRGSFGLSVDRAKEYKIDEVNENARVATETAAQDAARKAQEGQVEERQRRRRFAYGYNRASGGSSGGLGGAGDAGGGQKTLLGY
jgi:hypothetical protein